MGLYRPNDWFWFVAGDKSRVYSSRLDTYVPLTDAGYLAHIARGNFATNILNEEELADVLRAQNLPFLGAAPPPERDPDVKAIADALIKKGALTRQEIDDAKIREVKR